MFSVHFLPNNTNESDQIISDIRLGKIVIGDFSEDFEASLSYWNIDKYQESWRKGIKRLLNRETKSCIITSMYDPKYANFIIWWPMYLEDGIVYIQNQLLFLKGRKTKFNPDEPYCHIRDRETVTDDNLPISEWEVPIEALEKFLNGF